MAEFMTATTLENFVSVLREHEVKTFSKFVCSRSDKSFTETFGERLVASRTDAETQFTPAESKKVHWNGDTPYFHIGQRVYACHQGKDQNLYQKKRYAEKRALKACEDYRAQLTKKLDCPVVIHVSRLLTLPNFKVNKLTRWEKNKMANLIKSEIKKGEELAGEIVYKYNLPDQESHRNHVCGADENMVSIHQAPIPSTVEEMLLPEDVLKSPSPSPDKQLPATACVFELSSSKTKCNNQKHSKDKTQLIRECNAAIRSLQSAMHLLDETKLEQLRNNLNELQKDATLHVTMDCNATLPISNTRNDKLMILRKYVRLPKPKKKKAKKIGRADHAIQKDAWLLNCITSECSLPPSNKKFRPNGKKSVHKKQMIYPENISLGQSGSSQVMYSKNVIVLPEDQQFTWNQNIIHLS